LSCFPPLPVPPASYFWWVETPGNTQRGQTRAMKGTIQLSAAALAVVVLVVVVAKCFMA